MTLDQATLWVMPWRARRVRMLMTAAREDGDDASRQRWMRLAAQELEQLQDPAEHIRLGLTLRGLEAEGWASQGMSQEDATTAHHAALLALVARSAGLQDRAERMEAQRQILGFALAQGPKGDELAASLLTPELLASSGAQELALRHELALRQQRWALALELALELRPEATRAQALAALIQALPQDATGLELGQAARAQMPEGRLARQSSVLLIARARALQRPQQVKQALDALRQELEALADEEPMTPDQLLEWADALLAAGQPRQAQQQLDAVERALQRDALQGSAQRWLLRLDELLRLDPARGRRLATQLWPRLTQAARGDLVSLSERELEALLPTRLWSLGEQAHLAIWELLQVAAQRRYLQRLPSLMPSLPTPADQALTSKLLEQLAAQDELAEELLASLTLACAARSCWGTLTTALRELALSPERAQRLMQRLELAQMPLEAQHELSQALPATARQAALTAMLRAHPGRWALLRQDELIQAALAQPGTSEPRLVQALLVAALERADCDVARVVASSAWASVARHQWARCASRAAMEPQLARALALPMTPQERVSFYVALMRRGEARWDDLARALPSPDSPRHEPRLRPGSGD